MLKLVALAVVTTLMLACGGSSKAAGPPAKPPGRIVVTDTVIEFLDPVTFVGDTAEITPASSRILDAVASTLDANPKIKSVMVHAYVVDGADKAAQQEIADHRARAVLDYLVSKKVAADRLQSSGTVEAAGGTPRVAFEVLKRD